MTLQEAQQRLLAYVRDRIHNGELTERGFGRQLGISQPHVHNVLKGARSLSPEVFDSMLRHFHLSLLDLAEIGELESNIKKRQPLERAAQLPFLSAPIGPGRRWPRGVNWTKTFPSPLPGVAASPGIFMTALVADPSMAGTLFFSDLALLDTSPRERRNLSPAGLYVVSLAGAALLRFVRQGARGYYLISDDVLNNPLKWERVDILGTDLLHFVRARVLWLGRERDRGASGGQKGRVLYDPTSA